MRDVLALFALLGLAWWCSRLSRSLAVQREVARYLTDEFERIESRPTSLTTVVAPPDAHAKN